MFFREEKSKEIIKPKSIWLEAVNQYNQSKDVSGEILFRAGMSYLYGMDAVKIDCEKGAKILERAGKVGYPHAYSMLARCYAIGIGVKIDVKRAVELWKKEPLSMFAQKELAWCHKWGHYGCTGGEEKSKQLLSAALPSLLAAAEKGDPHAQFHLAYCHHHALGCRTNSDEAAKWYLLSAKQGHAEAQVEYGNLVFYKDKNAIEWFRLAAKQNCCDAQFALGCCYLLGKQVEADRDEARMWFQEAANGGHQVAQLKLNELGVSRCLVM